MKVKEKSSCTIIGGSDGPTSVFVVGSTGKKSPIKRVKKHIHQWKRKRAEKKIISSSHTLNELAAYAMDYCGAVEIPDRKKKYVEEKKNLKESLILMHKPELLGDFKEIPKPDVNEEASVGEFLNFIHARSEKIAKIPDSEFPMDFHLYVIKSKKGYLEMGIDYYWKTFDISYCGRKQAMKKFRRIAKDLYLYYGVNEEDIRKKTERYSALLAALSE